MTDLIELARVELTEAQPVDAACEARFPVAYSHGGFAQLRHALPVSEANPLAPIEVPAGFDATVAANYGSAAVVFLRT